MSKYLKEDESRSRGTIPASRSSTSAGTKKKSASTSSAGAKKTSTAGKAAAKTSGKSTSSRTASYAKRTTQKKRSAPKAERDQRTVGGSASRREKQLYELDKRRRSDEELELYRSEEAREIVRKRKQRAFNKSHKRNSIIFYVSLSIAAITVIVVMSLTVLFNISTVNVVMEGELPYTEGQIAESSRIVEGQNLFMTSLENCADNVVSSLPYVETCKVQRKLPSTIVITARAADIAGVVTTPTGQRAVMSAGGRVLEIISGDREISAPELYGLEVSSLQLGEDADIANYQAMEWIKIINEEFRKAGLSMESITIEEKGSITAMYDGRIRIIFGQPIELQKKAMLASMLITDGSITSNESGDINVTKINSAIFTPDYVNEQKEKRKQQYNTVTVR